MFIRFLGKLLKMGLHTISTIKQKIEFLNNEFARPSLCPARICLAATRDFPSFSKHGNSHSCMIFFPDPMLFSIVRIAFTISEKS